MLQTPLPRVLAVALLLAASLANSFAESSFKGLGFLQGGSASVATAVSDDGKIIVGICEIAATLPDYLKKAIGDQMDAISGTQAFRWSAASGMVALGVQPGYNSSSAYHVASNGSVIVGDSGSDSRTQAFRWTVADGMIGLGHLVGGGKHSEAFCVSSDGLVIVGHSDCVSGSQAFRWTRASGMVGLGYLPGGHVFSSANGASRDGSVVVGESKSTSGRQAFRWTAESGMVGLGLLPGSSESHAAAVSNNGKVVVGYSGSTSRAQAFRWTIADGMVGLGHPAGESMDSNAEAISGDGSIIVGKCAKSWSIEPSPEDAAMIWDSVNGMRVLQSILTNVYHLDLAGWKLTAAGGISTDGKTIVGVGKHNGRREAWVAHLDRPVNEVGRKKPERK